MTDYPEPTWTDPSDDEHAADVEAFEAEAGDSEIETETEPEGQGR